MSTMFEALSLWAEAQPEALALITEADGTRTYAELVHNAAAIGAALHGDLGVAPGETVTLLAANRPQWVETYLGVGAAGLRCVSGNPEWTDSEVSFILEHSESSAVICDSELAARIVALQNGLSRLRHVIAIADVDDEPVVAGAVSYAALIEGVPEDPAKGLPTEEFEFTEHIMYTSGTTTGRPKAVINQVTDQPGIDYEEMFGITAKDRGIVVTPFFHGNGMGGLMVSLLYGASVVITRRFSGTRFWKLVDLYRPTFLFTLSPIVNILLGRPQTVPEKRHNLRVIIALGAGADRSHHRRAVRGPGHRLVRHDRGRNGHLHTTRRGPEARVGRPAIPRLHHDDPASGRDGGSPKPGGGGGVRPGHHILRRLSEGRRGHGGGDRRRLVPHRRPRLLRRGRLFLLRRPEEGHRPAGGENISSLEIEGVMRLHPHVADAAILGKPDAVLGERVVAFVVPAEEYPDPDVASIQDYVGEHLAKFKVPEEIFLVDELPRTSTGKIIKARLRPLLPADDRS